MTKEIVILLVLIITIMLMQSSQRFASTNIIEKDLHDKGKQNRAFFGQRDFPRDTL